MLLISNKFTLLEAKRLKRVNIVVITLNYIYMFLLSEFVGLAHKAGNSFGLIERNIGPGHSIDWAIGRTSYSTINSSEVYREAHNIVS